MVDAQVPQLLTRMQQKICGEVVITMVVKGIAGIRLHLKGDHLYYFIKNFCGYLL